MVTPNAMPQVRTRATIGPVKDSETLSRILGNMECDGWEYQSIDYSAREIVMAHATDGRIIVKVG